MGVGVRVGVDAVVAGAVDWVAGVTEVAEVADSNIS